MHIRPPGILLSNIENEKLQSTSVLNYSGKYMSFCNPVLYADNISVTYADTPNHWQENSQLIPLHKLLAG